MLPHFESLAELAFQKEALARQAGGRHRRIHARRDRPVIGDRHAGAELLRIAEAGEQEAALALHRMVGNFEHRQIDDRLAEQLEPGVFQPDRMGAAVLNDALRLDVPERTMIGIDRAGRAGGVDGLVEDDLLAIAPLAVDGGELGQVRRLDAHRFDEAIGEIVRDVHLVGIDLVAAGLDQLDLAGRDDSPGLLAVFDLLGDHLVAAIIDLHRTAHDDALGITVVDELVGRQQHLGVGGHVGLERVEARRLRVRNRHSSRKESKSGCAGHEKGGQSPCYSAVCGRH